jgi:hypothetical protein
MKGGNRQVKRFNDDNVVLFGLIIVHRDMVAVSFDRKAGDAGGKTAFQPNTKS